MNQQGGQKTEKPTPKRLRDAKKKGNVPRSKDLAAAFILTMFTVLVLVASPFMMSQIEQMVLFPLESMNLPFKRSINEITDRLILNSAYILLPILAIIIIATIAGSMLSGGWVFAPEKIKPKVENMNPVEAVKKIFSVKNAVEFLKSILKAVIFVVIFYYTTRFNLDELVKLPVCGIDCVAKIWGELTVTLLIYFAITFIIFSVFDLIFQKQQHIKSLMMSLEEIKKESKEQEGDPYIKGERRALYQEIVFDDMYDEVDQSTAVVANPTHILVGIYYKQGETSLPYVTFMYKDEVALKLKEYAREQDIPVVENVSLARGLLKKGKKYSAIPAEFIKPVAEVIKFVQKLEKEKKAKEEPPAPSGKD